VAGSLPPLSESYRPDLVPDHGVARLIYDAMALALEPYVDLFICETMSSIGESMNACEEAIKKEKIQYQRGGTYVVMEGPQFSTLAESNLYRYWKADVIGMTNMPEAKLAREAEIRYASVSMVTDYDCWHPDHENVEVQMIIKTLMDNAEKAKNMIKIVIENFESEIKKNDPANNCLDTAIITYPNLMTKKTKKKLKNIAGRVLFKK